MMKTTVLVKLDERDPDLSRLREIVRGARQGKVVGFPTETVYGIGLPMSVAGAQATLAGLKKRESDKPFAWHIGELDMLDALKIKPTPEFRYLMRHFWPGPVTLLAAGKDGQKVGLRFPRNRLATALFNACGEPFVATSANMSGAKSPRTAEEVMTQLGGQIDYLIDGGPTEIGQDSTIVDMTTPVPVILRAAAMAKEVEAAVKKIESGNFPRKRILVVCTGNSCRSPMAAGWLTAELRRKNLADKIEVISCGIGARTGATATSEAVLVMKNREVDISAHRSRPCSRQDIMDADLIIAMGPEHYTFITGLVPAAREKIKMIGIPDPIGMGMMIYEEVILSIEKKLREAWKDIVA